MLYMIIERFRNGEAAPVYRRFRGQGRLMPEGLEYVSSWVARDYRQCYQVMRTENRELLDAWMSRWSDLMEFEVVPVVTSAEAVDAMARRDNRG